MKYCQKCQVYITEDAVYCPLCQDALGVKKTEGGMPLFPLLPPSTQPYHLLLRIVAFVSIIVCSLSILFNLLFSIDLWWSIFTVGTVACVWISLANAIFKYKNLLKYLLYQSLIITLFSIFFDYFFGWIGWSITFVIPILFTLDMVVMYALSKLLKLQPGDYMIYLLMDAVFGILPIIFVGSDIVLTDIPSIICTITSIASVAALVTFEGRNMYNELKRRLHI